MFIGIKRSYQTASLATAAVQLCTDHAAQKRDLNNLIICCVKHWCQL